MRYPRANNYLTYRATGDGRCLISDYSGEEVSRYEVDMDTARFLHRLDGKTCPRKCLPDVSAGEVEGMLSDLKRNGLLRTYGRLLFEGIGSVRLTLWIPKARAGKAPAAKWWNRILMALWLPVLLVGAFLFVNHRQDYVGDAFFGDAQLFAGMVVWVAAAMLIHELSHGAAALSYGVKVFEFGLFLENFMPGAYTAIEDRRVRNRWHRIQIDAAGVESNFLLTGLCLIVGRWIGDGSILFLIGAMVNMVLGLSNLCFFGGLDGFCIFTEILGMPNFLREARQTLSNKTRRRKIREEMGMSGYALLFTYRAVHIIQIFMPAAILANLLSFWM